MKFSIIKFFFSMVLVLSINLVAHANPNNGSEALVQLKKPIGKLDTIILKSGEILSGYTIKNHQQKVIFISTNHSFALSIHKNEIKELKLHTRHHEKSRKQQRIRKSVTKQIITGIASVISSFISLVSGITLIIYVYLLYIFSQFPF